MSELSVNLKAVISRAENADPFALSNDRQLMMRLQRGDEAAMCELLERHGEMLARLVGRLTGWSSDREDILQDVLLTVWQKAGSFQGDGSLEGWLKRMVANRCRNHFRSMGAVKRLVERFALLVRPGEPAKPEGEIEQSESNNELQYALQQLGHGDRTALVLFYLEEMPGDEVARLLNIKTETLHVRLHRARKKLKQVIEDQRG